MQRALVIALGARRIDVVTALDCGMVNKSDEDHLRYATGDGRVLFSYNIRDYHALHEDSARLGQAHI